jgi:Ca-activated chloride channel family protein
MLQLSKKKLDALRNRLVVGALLASSPVLARAQASKAADPTAPLPPAKLQEYTIRKDVNLVVLHATVLDHKGRMVNNLKESDFRVSEDGVPQKLSVFSHADIPVTMGIVIDDSGSMRTKRASVNAAALTFVKTSNPQDQVFVVNFNDNYYLDTPGDFAQNMEELKAALDKIDSRGGTALRDALMASIDHLRLGNRDKKVLLVVTDGEDNESRYTLEELLRSAQKSNVVIYAIGLLGDEEPGGLFKMKGGEAKRAAKALKELTEATGGQAYFPKSLDQVENTCVQIAHDIRNQYTLAYYPTNAAKDGTYRTVRVQAFNPENHHALDVRTRTGYFAPKGKGETSSTAAASGG